MATAYYVQEGRTYDYTPGSAVAEGDIVILGERIIGIAQSDIAANTKGALAVKGVFRFTTADTFVQGEAAFMTAAGVITDDATDYYAGTVTKAVTSGTEVEVDINVQAEAYGS